VTHFNFELLDTSNPAAVLEYEAAFYQSFLKVRTNRLVQKLWVWDHEAGRVKTRIPYEGQLICVSRDQSGRLHAAMAFNVALRQFQAAAYGFAAPEAAVGAFEVLTFFALATETILVRANFWARCVALLTACGYHAGYATTAQRPLSMYQRAGWRVLEEREIESEKRYFLHYNIPPREQRDEPARRTLGLLIEMYLLGQTPYLRSAAQSAGIREGEASIVTPAHHALVHNHVRNCRIGHARER
jgi:hypothetical protein